MARLVFLGPPGAGKGTQAALLSKKLRIPHLSTGEILREEVRLATALGKEAERFMTVGQLVPDELVLRIVRDRLRRGDLQDGFILDGFPRTLVQAEALNGLARADRVIVFKIPEKVLVERLSQRWSCPVCGEVYSLGRRPPKIPGRCDREEAELVQRPDDEPTAVVTRLQVYRQQTSPLIEYYRKRGVVREVDADAPVPVVFERLVQTVESG